MIQGSGLGSEYKVGKVMGARAWTHTHTHRLKKVGQYPFSTGYVNLSRDLCESL